MQSVRKKKRLYTRWFKFWADWIYTRWFKFWADWIDTIRFSPNHSNDKNDTTIRTIKEKRGFFVTEKIGVYRK